MTTKRRVAWYHTPVSLNLSTVSAISLDTAMADGQREGSTITRTILSLASRISIASEQNALAQLSMGLTLWPVEAVGALPDPEVAEDEADWLWRVTNQTLVRTLTLNGAFLKDQFDPIARFREDLRGQRRYGSQQYAYYLIVHIPSGSVDIWGSVRTLVKMP